MNEFPHGDPVAEARLLLPWYITGKLTAAERQFVAEMLEKYPALLQEHDDELKMVGLLRNNSSLLQLTAVDSTPQRLDKLLKRIRCEEEAAEIPVPVALPPSRPGFRLGDFLRSLIPQGQWLMPANVVFASLLLVQIGVLGWFAHTAGRPETLYVTASAEDGGVAAVPVVQGMRLLVGFNDTAQVQQLREFLQKWNARVIDGPDANALFKVEIRGISPHDQRSEVILQQMLQDQAVLTFAGREFPKL